MKKDHNLLRETLSFGFEQTFTTTDWWADPGFTSTSDTPLKREKMLAFAKELAIELDGTYFESKDIWDHMQYEVTNSKNETQFYVTMDPGSIEVKTPPCLVHETESMAAPMFIAAQRAGVVAYRNWWYGVKAGTEGGCHVNMGGFTEETNPLKANPELVVKYAAYVHNRPWLHHPFMGIDVGPEGNAMRMDEKPGFEQVSDRFKKYTELYRNNKSLSPQETYDFFEDTNLIKEKGSYPSLYKFKTGLFLIEDRGQESLRNAEDFFLVSELRVKILEYLMTQESPEVLSEFPNLHTTDLTSFSLWENFKKHAPELGLDIEKFQRFFDRQFPVLANGKNVPKYIHIKDGRRPRVITEIQKRGDVVTGKTIDTSYKRFEVYTPKLSANLEIQINGVGIDIISPLKKSDAFEPTVQYVYLDIKYDKDQPQLKVQIIEDEESIESAIFNMNDMMWE
jgi:pyrimidine deaminase RibD-like protein